MLPGARRLGTFDWHSVQPATLRRMPRSETLVMLSTVAVTVLTHNLAYGVGVLVAMTLFARRVAHLTEVTEIAHPDDDTRVYAVTGQLFFASSNDLVHQFDDVGDPATVVIDLAEAKVCDASTIATLDAIETKYAAKGERAVITALDEHSAARRDRLAGHLGAGH